MLLSAGEAIIDLVATGPGKLAVPGRTFRLAAGGAPANVAVAASLLGLKAVFLGKVGDDPLGAYLTTSLAAKGVCLEIWRDQTRPTSLAFVSIKDRGERDFYFHPAPPAYLALTVTEMKEGLARYPALSNYHFGGVALAEEPARTASLEGAKLAGARGATVSFDPNWRPALWRDGEEARSWLLEAVALSHWVKMNEEEACFLSQRRGPAAASWFLERGAKLAVVTRGEEGCHYAWGEERGELAAYSVQAVDTTGAGDAFMGAMLAALPQGIRGRDDLEVALQRANAAGALTTLRRGAIPAFPTTGRLKRFLGVERG